MWNWKNSIRLKSQNRFAALQNLSGDDDGDDINRAWESIRENMKASATECLGYCELKQHKPLFNERSSKLLDQMKHTTHKLQWLQNSSQNECR
jgi:hypothetical protein